VRVSSSDDEGGPGQQGVAPLDVWHRMPATFRHGHTTARVEPDRADTLSSVVPRDTGLELLDGCGPHRIWVLAGWVVVAALQ